MDDLDLRLVRSFVVVAEHRHFGRAARELHLAQPALSRQIRRLEGRLGVRLFHRDTTGTRLTEAGRAFLPGAREALAAARVAAGAARNAGAPRTIVVGHTEALFVTSAVRAMRDEHPDLTVQTLHLDWRGPRAALLEHRVDLAVARMPFAADGLAIRPLYVEQRVLLVSAGHRLATRASLRLADFAGEPLVRLADADPAFAAFWRVEPRPDGRPAPPGPVVATPQDRFEAVAAGEAAALATEAILDGMLRPDLVALPVEDIDPVRVVVAARAGDHRSAVTAFARLALAHLSPGPGPPRPR